MIPKYSFIAHSLDQTFANIHRVVSDQYGNATVLLWKSSSAEDVVVTIGLWPTEGMRFGLVAGLKAEEEDVSNVSHAV